MNYREQKDQNSEEASLGSIGERVEQIENRIDQLSDRVDQIYQDMFEQEDEPVTDPVLTRTPVLTLTNSIEISKEKEDRLLDRLLK